MYYLLLFFTLTGVPVPEESWHHNHKFKTLEACTKQRIENQKIIDDLQANLNEPRVTFQCVRGPELLA